MATDWSKVLSDAIAAAQGVLSSAWTVASVGATSAIASLVQTAQYIDQNKDKMNSDEYQLLASQQKIALQNVLTGYECIGIAAAQNATANVVNAIVKDVPTLIGIVKQVINEG